MMMVMMMVVMMMMMMPWVDCCDTHNLTLACLCHMAVSSPMRVTCSRPRRPWETGLAPKSSPTFLPTSHGHTS